MSSSFRTKYLPFSEMCKGENPEAAKQHKTRAEYHDMMSKFYTLSREDQLVFMAAFDQLSINQEAKQ